MIRYVSCKQCAFSADATDLRGLGSQFNTHGSDCGRDPVLVLDAEQDQADSAIQAPGEFRCAVSAKSTPRIFNN